MKGISSVIIVVVFFLLGCTDSGLVNPNPYDIESLTILPLSLSVSYGTLIWSVRQPRLDFTLALSIVNTTPIPITGLNIQTVELLDANDGHTRFTFRVNAYRFVGVEHLFWDGAIGANETVTIVLQPARWSDNLNESICGDTVQTAVHFLTSGGHTRTVMVGNSDVFCYGLRRW